MVRLGGWLWLGVWFGILYALVAPWRDLGGLESERLRWLERFVVLVGLVVGFLLGHIGRQEALRDRRRTHLRFLRLALVPPAAVTAVALVALRAAGETGGPIGVVATAFAAYWAGLDLAYGAVPLMHGRPWSLARPLEPEADARARLPEKDWVPPWERP
jgi:hypothetical protein